jgi:hypothetical protein
MLSLNISLSKIKKDKISNLERKKMPADRVGSSVPELVTAGLKWLHVRRIHWQLNVLLRIRKVPGSNLGLETGYRAKILCGFSQSLHQMLKIRLRPFPSTVFPIHHSLDTSSVDTVWVTEIAQLNSTKKTANKWMQTCMLDKKQQRILHDHFHIFTTLCSSLEMLPIAIKLTEHKHVPPT